MFLDLDREPDPGVAMQEASLRGVRKAQARLATFCLASDDEARARRIFEDLRHESTARLDSIRAELESITELEFWEMTDRGINLNWMPPERRACLDRFFGWFQEASAQNS